MKNNYIFSIRTFKKWVRENIYDIENLTIKIMKQYKIWLNEHYERAGTLSNKWAAAKQYFINNANYKLEYKIKELAWLDYKIPNKKRIQDRAYLINEAEYKKLLKNCKSDKDECFIKYIWYTGKKITDVINTLNEYNDIPIELYNKINNVFNGRKYLFETSTHHIYNRNYITSRIKKLGKDILNKNISSESLRTNYFKKAS